MMCPNRGNLFQPRAAVSVGSAAGTTPARGSTGPARGDSASNRHPGDGQVQRPRCASQEATVGGKTVHLVERPINVSVRENVVGTQARPSASMRGSCLVVQLPRFARFSCFRRPARARASLPGTWMVRRGSTVRVRQRASRKSCKWAFCCLRRRRA